MGKTFLACYKFRSFEMKCIITIDNAPSYVSKLTREVYDLERFTEEKIMQWLSTCPVLKKIENLRLLAKISLYEGGKEFENKIHLWEVI